jgi:hypothetical protein
MITHGKSAFTFFIPYADAGGAKGIIHYFKEQLKDLFLRNSLPTLALEVNKLFAGGPTYTKTVDRKILGHMNDFRRRSEPYPGDPYPIDWQDKAERINNMPLNAGSRDSSYAIENFNELLGINVPKRKTRYS